MNASLPFSPPINTDIDYYQANFLYELLLLFILVFVSYAMLVMHGL